MREVISGPHALINLSLSLTVVRSRSRIHRALLAETSAVALAGVCRFQFRLLAGRNEVSVLFEVFDDLFRDNLALETTESTLDRFIVIY